MSPCRLSRANDPEADRPDARLAPRGRPGDEAEAIGAAVEDVALRAPAGQAERVVAGQEVAHAREQADLLALLVPQLDVQAQDRLDDLAAAHARDAPDLERDHRR